MLALVLPGLVYFIVFHYIALLGNVIAFLDYQPFLGFFDSPWVGLANFQSMILDARFWQAVRNTIVIFSLQLLLFFPAPIALALLLNSLVSVRTRRVIQSIVYLPHFFSWVLVVTLFQQMLGGAGVLNAYLRQHDLGVWNIMSTPAVSSSNWVAGISFASATLRTSPIAVANSCSVGSSWARRE